jgi:hypothetical protein
MHVLAHHDILINYIFSYSLYTATDICISFVLKPSNFHFSYASFFSKVKNANQANKKNSGIADDVSNLKMHVKHLQTLMGYKGNAKMIKSMKN